MFTIKNDQIAVFAEKTKDQFLDRMVAYVRDNFPLKFSRFGLAATRDYARKTMQTAKTHGFETERQIVSWLDLGLRHGRFWQEAWAKPYLDPDSAPAERRMRDLQMATLDRVGEARR